MRTGWQDAGVARSVWAPVSLIVSAFAPVGDVRRTLTPQLRCDVGPTRLVLIDLGRGRDRTRRLVPRAGLRRARRCAGRPGRSGAAGGVLRRGARGGERRPRPRLPRPLRRRPARDAGRDGLRRPHAALRSTSAPASPTRSRRCAPRSSARCCRCARPISWRCMRCWRGTGSRASAARSAGRSAAGASGSRAASASCSMSRSSSCGAPGRRRAFGCASCATIRPARARSSTRWPMPTIRVSAARPSFDPDEDVAAPYIARGARPRVAILREQGVNSQLEMAAAFARAGFAPDDVHMTDVLAGRVTLADYPVLVACGGFSYGDVLGAGEGWAKSILFNAPRTRRVRALLRARRHADARRLQRLPDGRGARRADPRRRALAALHAQPLRAVRGPAVAGRGARHALAVPRRHGGLRAADRGRARRGPGELRARGGPRGPRARARRSRCASSTTTAGPRAATPRTRTARRPGSPASPARTAA